MAPGCVRCDPGAVTKAWGRPQVTAALTERRNVSPRWSTAPEAQALRGPAHVPGMLRGIVLDLDGTLVDTNYLLASGFPNRF